MNPDVRVAVHFDSSNMLRSVAEVKSTFGNIEVALARHQGLRERLLRWAGNRLIRVASRILLAADRIAAKGRAW